MGEVTSNKKPGDRSPGFLLHWWRWRERYDDPAQLTEPEGFRPRARREKRYPKRDLARLASPFFCRPGGPSRGLICRDWFDVAAGLRQELNRRPRVLRRSS